MAQTAAAAWARWRLPAALLLFARILGIRVARAAHGPRALEASLLSGEEQEPPGSWKGALDLPDEWEMGSGALEARQQSEHRDRVAFVSLQAKGQMQRGKRRQHPEADNNSTDKAGRLDKDSAVQRDLFVSKENLDTISNLEHAQAPSRVGFGAGAAGGDAAAASGASSAADASGTGPGAGSGSSDANASGAGDNTTGSDTNSTVDETVQAIYRAAKDWGDRVKEAPILVGVETLISWLIITGIVVAVIIMSHQKKFKATIGIGSVMCCCVCWPYMGWLSFCFPVDEETPAHLPTQPPSCQPVPAATEAAQAPATVPAPTPPPAPVPAPAPKAEPPPEQPQTTPPPE